jgi:hypothetical protein
MIHHILVTRFNIKEETWKESKNKKPVGNLIWLENRIYLFNKFCLPSVLNQSNKNFYWIIFFEEGTQKQIERVLQNIMLYSFIFPVFVKGMNGFNEMLPIYVENLMTKPALKIITTRLDNDDAIHEDFIKNIQMGSDEDFDKFFIDFPKGLCLSVVEVAKISRYMFPKNQFLSLVERIKTGELPRLVFCNFHNKLDTEYPIKSLTEENQWLQIVHEDNLINSFKGSLTYSRILNGYPDFEICFSDDYDFSVFKVKIKHVFSKLPGYYWLKKILNKTLN